MDATKPLHEQLAECELWCAQRREEEYREVATKGLRVLPEHHGELAKPLPGQTPQADGWLLRSDVMGVVQWLGLGFLLLFAVWSFFSQAMRLVEIIAVTVLSAGLWLWPKMRSHEIALGGDVLVVRRRIFGRLHQEWRLSVAGEVRVGLAYRGVQVSRGSKHVGTVALLSVVVASGGEEVVFGTDLDREERARLAILIDHYFNGVA